MHLSLNSTQATATKHNSSWISKVWSRFQFPRTLFLPLAGRGRLAVPRGLKPRSLGKCRERGKYAHPAVRPSYHIIDHLCSTADSLSEEDRGMERVDQMYQEIGWSPPHMHAVQSEAILHCWCAHPGQVRLGKSRFLSALLRSSLHSETRLLLRIQRAHNKRIYLC